MPIVLPPPQLELLRRIQELEFVAIDLNLYLDTHPDDQQALAHYNCVVEQLMALRQEYEGCYTLLTAAGFEPARCPWQWIDEPWPWQICY